MGARRVSGSDVVRALEAIAAERARLPHPPPPTARRWVTSSDVARHLNVEVANARAALKAAAAKRMAVEHGKWPGYYKTVDD